MRDKNDYRVSDGIKAALAAAAASAMTAINTACTAVNDPGTEQSPAQSGSPSVSYLCIGMESSSRFGSCPGAGKDADRMNELLSGYGYSGKLIKNGSANKKTVKEAIENGMKSQFFIFFYAGHGGQENLGGEEPEGADSQDEFLCLNDTYMQDDEIWGMLQKASGRVFMIFDCCRSATMYRSVSSELNPVSAMSMARTSGGFSLEGPASKPRASSAVSLLCWSGCGEPESSMGSSSGGVFTNNILKSWKNGISYSDLWESAKAGVESDEPSQHPVRTEIGSAFDGKAAFE